jgi:hypothetical protein
MGHFDEEMPTEVFEDSDTIAIDFRVGGRVRCMMGVLKGIEGVVAATRSNGRLLIRVVPGIYVELPRVCLEAIGPGE